MTGWCDHDAQGRGKLLLHTARRWTLAAMAIVALHGACVWAAWHWRHAVPLTNDPPPAVMIALAPLAVAPPAPPQEVAPGPQMVEAQPEPATQARSQIEDTPEARPDAATVQTKPDVPDVSEITPPPETKLLEAPKQDKADAVLAPRPPARAKNPEKPAPKKHQAERKKPIDPERPKRAQTTAPPSVIAHPSEIAAAPSSGASSSASVSPATWKSELMAHLVRFKRFPPSATGAGTVTIAFTINRAGQVLGARLITSSGDPALDVEALSLPRRASPVPAPPPNIGADPLTLTVPIRFNR